MSKRFNITGSCSPTRHYMADVSAKLAATTKLIEEGAYFIINRPRQYGKTTMLNSLFQRFDSVSFLPLLLTFEDFGNLIFQDESSFCRQFAQLLGDGAATANMTELADWVNMTQNEVIHMHELSNFIGEFVKKAGKKVIVIIDEVDKSSNNQLFLDFLGVLRTSFLARDMRPAFHSVVLAGVHDVKNLKLKLRPGEEQKFNSPWNIATDYKVDMNLFPNEIEPMLADYCQERGVSMDIAAIAEKLFYYTSGYPFLVSKLCKMLDEDIMPQKETLCWEVDDLETAVKELRYDTNVNFDTVIKNLENYPELYDITHLIVVEGYRFPFNPHEPTTNLGMMYGIFAAKNGSGLKIHNRIYFEHILNYMTVKMLMKERHKMTSFHLNYLKNTNELDMRLVLTKFQTFMFEQYSAKDRAFVEREGRLIFLAFLKPILNGAGHDFKEPQISEERRLDIAVTFNQHKYIVELKLWYGEKAFQEGLEQLGDYLEKQDLTEGYLVVFDHSKKRKTRQQKDLTIGDKKVFAVWV